MFRTTTVILSCAALCACLSPPPEPLDEVELARGVEARSATVEKVEEALDLLDEPDRLPLLDLDRLEDADEADFWQASALVYEPGLRAARREVEAAVARLASAGLPGRVGLSGRTLDLNDLDRDSELSASIDLLGLLGLGPSAAASALADANLRRAGASLEEAAWQARFRVELARVACAAQVGLLAELRSHAAEVAVTMRRFDALERLGRLPPSALARARTHARLLAQNIAVEERALVDRRAALARLAGVPTTQPMLARLSAATLDRVAAAYPVAAPPAPADFVRRHPELRRLCFDYALAEASLRRAVAENWPTLRVGPRAKFTPDDFITGGLVDVTLPWPGAADGEIEAEVAQRSRARERLEEALVDVLARARSAREKQRIAEVALREEAAEARRQAAVTWRGLQARFGVDESRWDLWTDALNLRSGAIREYWRAREAEAVSRLALARELALTENEE